MEDKELKEVFEILEKAGWQPQLCDTPIPVYESVHAGKPIDSKLKWAGAQWLLRWECNYPPKAQDFCEKIASLPLPDDLEYKCEYNNIRALSTLSFMNEDARKLESVKYSKNDEQAFFQLRGVVVALAEELQKTTNNR